MPHVLARVEAVRKFRAASRRGQTVRAADFPTCFGTELILKGPYLLIPKVSSERRRFIPFGFETPDTFCSDLVFMLPDADRVHFSVLLSSMHNAWIRSTCGRLESDYRHSAAIVYNNCPWSEPTEMQRATIEAAAQAVLDTRAQFPEATLADLYDPLTMPPALLKAHQKLDAAVDAAYAYRGAGTDAARVAFLFERYRALSEGLPEETSGRARASKVKGALQ